MSRTRVLACVILSLLFPALPAFAANSVKNLPQSYRHWIEAEVPYIITSDERKEFLALTADEQRDSFIAEFWRLRNPDPHSEVNTYKQEHYRRLAYANEHFGNAKYENGWRTAMGRIYIVLGQPKQRATYHEQANLRPIEIWFYEADTPALPPHFYVLFFKHSTAEDWRLYSPTQDGPAELVTTGESQNDNKMALRFIRKSAGDEVAKTACTLIPAEHADFDNFSPSMESDILLATINGLADNPLTKEKLEANRLREHVTTSILTGDQDLSLDYDVVRDEKGRETLSCLLRTGHLDSRLVGRRPDGSLYYDLSLRVSVRTPDGKSAYDQEDQLTGSLTEAQAEAARKKRFAAEARVPLAPGTYVLEATLTNNLDHVASKKRATVTVPAVRDGELGISPLLAYASRAAISDPRGQLPFSISRLRFTPHGAQTLEVRQGDSLSIVFQLWVGAKPLQSVQPDKIHLRYVFGTVTANHSSPSEEQEDIDASNHDMAGNLLTGHTLDTSGLGPGYYRLVVSAARNGASRIAYATATVKVIPTGEYVDLWTAYGPSDPGGEALDDLKRGLSAEALGSDAIAQDAYNRAMTETLTDMRPLEKLANLRTLHKDTDELAAMSRQPILARAAASPKTLLEIAKALNERKNPNEVVHLLEVQTKLQPPNVDLYNALADAYEMIGDASRAKDLRILARGK